MQVYKAVKYLRLSYTDDKTTDRRRCSPKKTYRRFFARHPEIEETDEYFIYGDRQRDIQQILSHLSNHDRKSRGNSFSICIRLLSYLYSRYVLAAFRLSV